MYNLTIFDVVYTNHRSFGNGLKPVLWTTKRSNKHNVSIVSNYSESVQNRHPRQKVQRAENWAIVRTMVPCE